MQLTKNFSLSEFKCHDGTDVPKHLIPNVQLLADNLQVLRDALGVAININSGYRTNKYNKAVGGASKSQHKEAKAGDLSVKGFTPEEVADTIQILISEGKMKEGGLGRYNSFTHYDVRDGKARWDMR